MSITITAEHPEIVLSDHTTDEFLTALKDGSTLWLTKYDTYAISTLDATEPGTPPGTETATFRVEARTVLLPLRIQSVTFDNHACMSATASSPEMHGYRSVEHQYRISQDRRGAFSIEFTGNDG